MSGGFKKSIGSVALALALLSFVQPVAAAVRSAVRSCYQPTDIEAQEAMRYQAKLMVLSDTCGGQTYRNFTVRNRLAIIRYQHELIAYFRRTGSRHPESSFDNFITGLANEISLHAGETPLAGLCSQSADFLAQADKLDDGQFQHYIAGVAQERKADYRRCVR